MVGPVVIRRRVIAGEAAVLDQQPAGAGVVRGQSWSPLSILTEWLARLGPMLGQHVTSFCDLATCDDTALISFKGDYATVVAIAGMRRNAATATIEHTAAALRLSLSSAFNEPGHAMQFFYDADPDGAHGAVADSIEASRTIADGLRLDFEDVFAERTRRLPRLMRREHIGVVLWTREGKLSRQEKIAASRTRKAALKAMPSFGDAQNPFLGSPELATIHAAFVQSVLDALDRCGVDATALPPKGGLRLIRQALYPDTRGSAWHPITPADRPPDIVPDRELPADLSDVLWPPLREQLFMDDAVVPDFGTARLGVTDWTPIELTRTSEAIRPFKDLVSVLADRRVSWQFSALVEGTLPRFMFWKAKLAELLKFGMNVPIHAGFEEMHALRQQQADNAVKLRVGFATRAPVGESRELLIAASQLQQAIGAWGGAQASRVCGDPLAGVLATMPGLAIAATAPATAAPLSAVLTMMPWARPAAPWASGPMLARTVDGTVIALDPAGLGRDAVLDIFVAPSRRGKSMLSNALLLATILSSAAMTNQGPRIPLIGKLDIGSASAGLVDMVSNALRPEDRHLVLHVPFQLIEEHAVNIFDTEACCRHPLEYHRTFLTNFLNLVCNPPDGPAFEGMNQLISKVVTAAFDLCSDDGPSVRPKPYREEACPAVAQALRRHRITPEKRATWWSVADALAAAGDLRMAGFATRHAVPTIGNLLDALNEERVRTAFANTSPTGRENLLDVFRRYINHFIDLYPTLNRPTQLDLGEARLVVLDIDRVAPEGPGEPQWRTELMYLLGLHIVSRNFFLRAEDARNVPEPVREAHRRRFREFEESFKRLECDEFQRTAGTRYVQQQFEEVARRGAKRNFAIGLASQKLSDFGDYLAGHSTGRFILGAEDDGKATEIIERFQLTDASAEVLRNDLKGPYKDGRGAPYLLQVTVRNEVYELHLLNTLGPVELWALSTTPQDTALRSRLYDKLGSREARRRLAVVFPTGTAVDEIERRTQRRIQSGEDTSKSLKGAADELAREIFEGTGLGTVIRQSGDDAVSRAAE